MNNCKILLIDSPQEIILMEEVLNCLSLPIELRSCSSLSEAFQEFEMETPDMIMIGSGMLLWNGLEAFKNRIMIPTVILCEGEGYIGELDNFWRFASERLIGYKGTEQKYFILFLKELEFRYNHRNGDLFNEIVAKIAQN